MNLELERLVKAAKLDRADNERLRLELGLLFVERIEQQLEREEALDALKQFKVLMRESFDAGKLRTLAQDSLLIANHHPGSTSIDGTQHSAVSATYALANAINGNVLEAAAYAAYSKIYGYGGYALSDPSSFEEEYKAQVAIFKRRIPETV